MAVLAAATIVFVLLDQEGAADAATWSVLTGGAVLGCGVLAWAVWAGRGLDRSTAHQYASLRRTVALGQSDLQNTLQRLENGEPVPHVLVPQPPQHTTDLFGTLVHEINVAGWQARAAVLKIAQQQAPGLPPDSAERVEVFVNLARRLQSLVHRAINMLDLLENEVEDPELLKRLFTVDHLATRIRRHAENVAVLGGSVSRRQWTRPVTLTEVLRSSIAEVEHYSRVKLVPPIEGTLRGHAVADVIHLLAELVENATMFSEPQTQVLLRAQRVTAGLAIEVEDRGLGMPLDEQHRINALLEKPDTIDISKLLADGRIGLYVVSALARRHNVAVRLQSNIYGGIQAVLIIPHQLLGDEPAGTPVSPGGGVSRSATAAPMPVQVAPSHHGQPPVPMPQNLRQPLPPAQVAAAPMPAMQHHASAAAPTAQERGPVYGGSSHDGRPPLPQRQAQEHLAPELRDGPAPRSSEDREVEHDPGLMANFQRGTRRADQEPEDPSPHSLR